MMAVWGLGRRF